MSTSAEAAAESLCRALEDAEQYEAAARIRAVVRDLRAEVVGS